MDFRGVEKVFAANRDLVSELTFVMGDGCLNTVKGGGESGNRRLAETLHIAMGRILDILGGCIVDGTHAWQGSISLAWEHSWAKAVADNQQTGDEGKPRNQVHRVGIARHGLSAGKRPLPGCAN